MLYGSDGPSLERFSFLCVVNILLFHQHFNTPKQGGAIRSYYLATALVRKGHRAVVITSCACAKGRTETIDGIEVIYLPVPYNNRFTFYARSLSFIRFVLAAIRAARPYRSFDLCYAISAPLTVAVCARWMKWRYGMPYWFEVGDLWPDAPIELGYIRNPLFKKLLFALEKSIYQNALGVVALSAPIGEAILRKAPGTRVEVITNMADCDFFRPEPLEPDQTPAAAHPLVISYIGALGVANGLHHVLICAEESMKNKLPVRFILCGDGAMLDELKAVASSKALDNVSFAGFVNRDGVKEILKQTDAVFISYLPSPILETGCPNKYFDGLASGKLIIVNFGGWIRSEVEASQCGVFIDQHLPGAFTTKLMTFLTDPGLLTTAQRNARHLAEGKYTRTEIGDRFASLFSRS